MAKLKQGNLFEEDFELIALREKQRKLKAAHQEIIQLPAKLAREKRELESTMPPMAEIRERQQINEFEKNLSRGQIENVLRTQRHSVVLTFLLLVAMAMLLLWAYQIMTN
jgi:hypothetical protein